MPTYFLNAVRSVRAAAPDDDLLVVDNASPDPALRAPLRELADADERVALFLRDENDVRQNARTGSLYVAYQEIYAHALAVGYLLQGDMQLPW